MCKQRINYAMVGRFKRQAESKEYKALKNISKSIETIIRVDKLTNEMDDALTQEILHIKNICDEAMKNYLDLYSL